MASDPDHAAASAADPLRELRTLLPEAVTALSGVALTGLASLLTPTSKSPTVDRLDLDRLQLLLRQERGWSQQREQELGDLRLKLLAKENEADQLRRARRASAKDAEQAQALRRRLARSNGAPSDEDAELRTFAWCCQFRMLPEAQRPPTSRGLRAQYLRVAKMYVAYGDALDKAGIAFRWIRYVAYGDGIFEQKVRAAQILAGCRPRCPLRPHRDLSGEVVVRLSWLGLEEDEAPALIRSLIEEGQGAAFIGR